MFSIRITDRACIAFLLLVVLGLWLPRFQGPIDLRYDAGVYYLTGVALASGKGYRILSEPGELNAIQYPPLLPAIIAGVRLASGASDPAVLGHILRFLYFVLSIANAWAAYAVGRRFLCPSWALFAALIPTLHVQTIFMSDLLFAEIPYSLATLMFFLWVLPSESGRSVIAGHRSHVWVAGLLAAAAFLLRTSGIALLAAWIADYMMHRQWRHALVAIFLGILCVGGWQAYIWQIKTDPTYASPAYRYQRAAYQYYNVGYLENLQYIDPFQPELGKIGLLGLAARAGGNLGPLIVGIGETITANRLAFGAILWSIWPGNQVNFRFMILPVAGLVLLAVLPIAGLIILALRREWLLPAYVAASLGLICVTPWSGQFLRYLSPLAPILAVLAAIALIAAANTLRKMLPKSKIALAPTLAILIASLIMYIQIYALFAVFSTQFERVSYRGYDGGEITYRLFFYDRWWKTYDAAIDWLSRTASRGGIVVTSTPHWIFVRTGLMAVMPPFEPDAVIAQELIDSVSAKYLLIDRLDFIDVSRRYAAPILQRFPERWKQIYASHDGSVQIYERRDSGIRIQDNQTQ